MPPKKKVSKTELRAQKARLRARLSNEIVDGGVDGLLEVYTGPPPHSQMKARVWKPAQEP